MAMTKNRSDDLPDFRKPPVAETVLSLQFEPIGGLTTGHIGLLWQRFRDELPFIEEHPPLSPVVEKFGPPPPLRFDVTIEEKLPAPRVWFLNQEKTELIQVQADRFIHNWRKVQGVEPYPHYEPIREKFRGEVAILEKFLNDEGFGALAVNQCEVTYINHIERAGVWEKHGQLERVLRNWGFVQPTAFLPEAEDAAIRLRFVILDKSGDQPIGRLHVVLHPAWKKVDNSPILSMSLTARGIPLSEDIEGAFAFFDLGRQWIVKGFADLTTPDMHRVWERIHG